jgi:hypothetical protein
MTSADGAAMTTPGLTWGSPILLAVMRSAATR